MEALFRGIPFWVHETPTPADVLCSESRKESKRFKTLKREWLTPVLYERDQSFPDSVYQAAGNDQRHYDTLSLAIVTAIVAISAFPFLILSGPLSDSIKATSFLGIGLIQLLLLLAFLRLAETARIGRRTMRAIEIGFDRRGFSANYNPETLFHPYFSLPTRSNLRAMSGFLIALNVLLGAMIAAGWFR